jgi:hypothetical protein
MNKHVEAINQLPEAKGIIIGYLKSLRKPVSKGPFLQDVSKNVEYYANKKALKKALLAIKVSKNYDAFFMSMAQYSLDCLVINHYASSTATGIANNTSSIMYLMVYRKVHNYLHYAI